MAKRSHICDRSLLLLFWRIVTVIAPNVIIQTRILVIFSVYMARASTAIGVSPTIKESVQKQAHSTRLTLKEVILMGMLAIDRLDDAARQELADQVHQMQVQGEI